MVKDEIRNQLQSILAELGTSDVMPQIEQPADISHGDYSTNIALIAAKRLGRNPRELAEKIIERFKIQDSRFKNSIDKLEVAGPGFINFWIAKEELRKNIVSLLNGYIVREKNGRKIIVEYSSPNIAKPFTIGHLRSTIIGDAIANLLEAVGYTVYRDSHVGDWGTQFGKQIYAIKTWGSEAEIENAERPVKVLVDLYVRFHEEAEKNPAIEDEGRAWFKKLEDGDPEARRIWQKCINWSWKEFDAIYMRLGVSFTENDGKGYGESFFEDLMQPVIDELRKKGLLKEGKDGAQLIFFDDNTSLPPLMILKKDGATLYSTRDLATDKFRLEKYGKGITIVNEVGAEQALYFQQLYAVEEMLNWFKKNQRVHVKHGLYRFKDEKMSTRKGNVIWLEEVLAEAVKQAGKLANRSENSANQKKSENQFIGVPELSEAVGIGALKWNDLKRDAKQDIVFDWDEMLNMEGNSGPYLQYTYARTRSVLAKIQNSEFRIQNLKLETGNLKFEIEEQELLRLIYKFDETVIEAAEKFSPNILCNYLFNLAQQFNLFYQKVPILKSDAEQREFRLAITAAVGNIIKTGLNLLGIEAPERM